MIFVLNQTELIVRLYYELVEQIIVLLEDY